MDRLRREQQAKLDADSARGFVPISIQLLRTRTPESHDHNEDHRNGHNNRIGFRIFSVIPRVLSILMLFPFCPVVKASDVGGISATSNPVANSSGQANVNAYQVLTGTFMHSGFTNGVVCQSETLTISPYGGRSANIKEPFFETYEDPVYDVRDLDGDGAPDNPGDILWYKTVQTLQKDNYSLNMGVTAQWSRPLDKEMMSLCKDAAATEIALRKATLNLRVLDYEISRLKHCGNLAKEGIVWDPTSKYKVICEDVLLTSPPGVLLNHSHSIDAITFDSSSVQSSSLEQTESSQVSSESSLEQSSSLSSPEASQSSLDTVGEVGPLGPPLELRLQLSK